MSCYLINNDVFFYPDEARLERLSSPESVKLQQPASRCLELLLKRRGELVAQNELLSYGWGEERARYITSNAFYQSMHHLRQSLSRAGLNDIIYTVPRKGMGLTENLQITFKTTDAVRKQRLSVFTPKWIRYGAVILLGIAGAGAIIRYFNMPHAESLFKTYTFKKINKCNIYSSSKNMTEQTLMKLLSRAGEDCQKEVTIFASQPHYSFRNSIIRCSVYNENAQQCESVIIMENIK